MKEFVAGVVTLGTAFIAAGIVYQIVRSQGGPAIAKDAASTVTSLSNNLFKSA